MYAQLEAVAEVIGYQLSQQSELACLHYDGKVAENLALKRVVNLLKNTSVPFSSYPKRKRLAGRLYLDA